MSSEESLVFARLRAASRRASPAAITEALTALPPFPAAPLPGADVLSAFLHNVVRNGGTADAVADRRGAVKAVSRFISERHGQRRLIAGHDQRLAALPWRDGGLLPRFGAAAAEDLVAVSYARCGIAETGSTVIWADRDNPAMNNLLPEAHVVLVDRDTVRPRLEALWSAPELSDPQRRPRSLMMVSGPSSTADIALQLVTGAHGPRAWHVIVVGVDDGQQLMAQLRTGA